MAAMNEKLKGPTLGILGNSFSSRGGIASRWVGGMNEVKFCEEVIGES